MTADNINNEDPHQSKIDPNDPRLAMGINKPRGRRLKKGPVMAVIFGLCGLVLLGLIIAMEQPKNQGGVAVGDQFQEERQAFIKVPDTITQAKVQPYEYGNVRENIVTQEGVNAPKPKYVPPLGPELPGDIGAAMVKPRQKPVENSFIQYGDGLKKKQKPSPEEELKKQQEAKAYTAGGRFRKARSRGPSVAGMVDVQKELLKKLEAGSLTGPGGSSRAGVSGVGGSQDSVVAQNMQDQKRNFITEDGRRDENYLESSLTWPKSRFELKAGSIIPISLETGINTDLPGEIKGRVRENVYDTVTGNYLLVPQGSTLMASYDSIITYGQERILMCWNRLIRPDGSSINLECAPGVDLAGYAGLFENVNNHYGKLLFGVAMSSVLSATTANSQGNVDGYNPTFSQNMATNAGEEISNVGQQITSKNLSIQPTLTVKPGFSANVLVNKDMILSPYVL